MYEVSKQIVMQYSHSYQDDTYGDEPHNPEEYYKQHYADLIRLMDPPPVSETLPSPDQVVEAEPESDPKEGYIELRQDLTALPAVVNLKNDRYNPHAYYPPECPLCHNKPCKSCPLPISPALRQYTLGQLIDQVVVQPRDKIFRDNAILYLSP